MNIGSKATGILAAILLSGAALTSPSNAATVAVNTPWAVTDGAFSSASGNNFAAFGGPLLTGGTLTLQFRVAELGQINFVQSQENPDPGSTSSWSVSVSDLTNAMPVLHFLSTSTTFFPGPPLSEVLDSFSGVIANLMPSTTYEIKVNYTDGMLSNGNGNFSGSMFFSGGQGAVIPLPAALPLFAGGLGLLGLLGWRRKRMAA